MQNKTPANRIQLVESNLERVIGWIRHNDGKIAVINAFQTILVGLFIGKLDDIICIIKYYPFDLTQYILCTSLILFVAFYTLSLRYVLRSLYPDIKPLEPSHVFFGGIAQMQREEFSKEFEKLSDSNLIDEMNKQIHINSQIAVYKFKNTCLSIRYLMLASISLLTTILTVSILLN